MAYMGDTFKDEYVYTEPSAQVPCKYCSGNERIEGEGWGATVSIVIGPVGVRTLANEEQYSAEYTEELLEEMRKRNANVVFFTGDGPVFCDFDFCPKCGRQFQK